MKQILVKNCCYCHYHEINGIGEKVCKFWDLPKCLEHEKIYEGFPNWCPLEDYKGSDD